MPGLGKTTLAKKIYNTPQVEHYFLRAWSCVSPNFRRREILLDILSNNFELPNKIFGMTDDDLCEELNKCLKGTRYLVVLDDLRSISAWYSIRRAFADDQNGSRVLITTRLHSVALRARRGSDPLPLRLLSDHECWRLLLKTIFPCPKELAVLGNQIAKSCKGLPMAVVTIAHLLKRTKEEDHWKHVAGCISSPDDDPQKQLMKILELCYNQLPNYLKPCFLYFGAFLEDKDIAVRKLIHLWIAEGLIWKNGRNNLEIVAEKYLLDLIDRGLVMVTERRSNGRVKTCCLPDMVRILCLTKAKTENFFQLMPSYNEAFGSSTSTGDLDYGVDSEHSVTSTSCCWLCIHSETKHFIRSRPFGPVVHSLLCFEANNMVLRRHSDISFICHNFKLLTVLDLECINMLNRFPIEIGWLFQLRYLGVKGDINVVPSSIGNLWKRQTFLLKGSRGKVELPTSLWRVATLRHVYVDGHFTFTEDGDPFVLRNLITLSTLVLSYRSEPILRRYASNVRKLRSIFEESEDYSQQRSRFPSLSFLTNLETMKIFSTGRIHSNFPFDLPSNLRSLTFSGFRLPWYEISAIGRLPNLEVLKLLSPAFEGHTWDMSKGGEFLRLKFLKLDGLDIRQWNAFRGCFPKLQRLVLRDCKLLVNLPSSFQHLPKLRMVEVKSCSRSVVESVMKIRGAQQPRGNKEFKILTRNDWYCSASS